MNLSNRTFSWTPASPEVDLKGEPDGAPDRQQRECCWPWLMGAAPPQIAPSTTVMTAAETNDIDGKPLVIADTWLATYFPVEYVASHILRTNREKSS
jgi:hypothetical protein